MEASKVYCPSCFISQPLVTTRVCHHCGKPLSPPPPVTAPWTEEQARYELGMARQRLQEDQNRNLARYGREAG
jgi:hypothetical protein